MRVCVCVKFACLCVCDSRTTTIKCIPAKRAASSKLHLGFEFPFCNTQTAPPPVSPPPPQQTVNIKQTEDPHAPTVTVSRANQSSAFAVLEFRECRCASNRAFQNNRQRFVRKRTQPESKKKKVCSNNSRDHILCM